MWSGGHMTVYVTSRPQSRAYRYRLNVLAGKWCSTYGWTGSGLPAAFLLGRCPPPAVTPGEQR